MSEACGSCGGGAGCSGGECSPEEQKLKERLGRIKHKIVVLSGKGGVGKSTIAANIAVALSLAGKKVGLMDVDVHGPSIPRLLSLKNENPHMGEDYMEPVPWSQNLSVISLGFLLPNDQQAVIWRGPVKIGLISQFVRDVAWGDLDFLVVDCPPGTGDEPLSALQTLGADAQAVIVTTPQGVAIDDVRRSVSFCRELGNPVLGIVENMSGFVCSHCGELENIFSSGGGEQLAAEMGVPFLGKIPLDPEIVRSGDEGFIFVKVHEHSKAAEALNRIVKPMLDLSGSLQEQNTPGPVTPTLSGNGVQKIAVPVANGKLCQHFGHCEQFALVLVDPETKTVKDTLLLNPPPHEPGVLPEFLAEQGANLVIAGGMGARAQSLFTDRGIQVVVGAPADTPENVALSYMNGTLVAGQNICDH